MEGIKLVDLIVSHCSPCDQEGAQEQLAQHPGQDEHVPKEAVWHLGQVNKAASKEAQLHCSVFVREKDPHQQEVS